MDDLASYMSAVEDVEEALETLGMTFLPTAAHAGADIRPRAPLRLRVHPEGPKPWRMTMPIDSSRAWDVYDHLVRLASASLRDLPTGVITSQRSTTA